jgi:glucose dehydrogenase
MDLAVAFVKYISAHFFAKANIQEYTQFVAGDGYPYVTITDFQGKPRLVNVYGAGHILGTYRMGTDAGTSVVNPDLRSHDHANLFLLGSGVFPTCATGNPTLTVAALAFRASRAVLAQL